jgi:periplasmic copper chaperone A
MRRTALARLVPAVLVLPLALSACGSSRDPLTYDDRDQGDSVESVAEDLSVLNLRVLPPAEGMVHAAGSDARVALSLVNEAAEADALTAVSSPAAASVAITKDTKPVTTLPVPARGTSEAGYSLVLRGLKEELRSGTYVTLTLTFQRAPQVTLDVPVSTPTVVLPRASANPDVNEPAHGGGGEKHSEVENVVEKAGSGELGKDHAEGESGH